MPLLYFKGIVYPFCIQDKMNLLKMQLHLDWIKGATFLRLRFVWRQSGLRF